MDTAAAATLHSPSASSVVVARVCMFMWTRVMNARNCNEPLVGAPITDIKFSCHVQHSTEAAVA